ncbi:MAG: hypothetical protein U1E23_17130 [Reyranellaceae bacterium]
MPDIHTLWFHDDGEIPNNPRCPVMVYKGAVPVTGLPDPALPFERLFATNGWAGGWRNGIYAYRHFHASSHEVLGIARGAARVEIGGARGTVLDVSAGDVVVLPAGIGHRRVEATADLLVVGAYPAGSRVDQNRPGERDHGELLAAVAGTGLPASDPVHGPDGPLMRAWRATPQEKPS